MRSTLKKTMVGMLGMIGGIALTVGPALAVDSVSGTKTSSSEAKPLNAMAKLQRAASPLSEKELAAVEGGNLVQAGGINVGVDVTGNKIGAQVCVVCGGGNSGSISGH